MRKILYILMLSGLCLGANATGTVLPAESPYAQEEPEVGEIAIYVKGTNIRVQNAQGLNLEIYNITGVKVATFRIDSADKTLQTNLQRGCYIVKIGKFARKISVL